MLWLAAGPLTTNDLWWHLAHGRAYAASGPWPEADPCLFTAERGPEPHQWLFALAVHGVDSAVGLHGLRVVHPIVVAGIALLAFALFRREAGRIAPACLATAVFLVLSWYRIVQFRPELFSIAATLLLCALLFEPKLPSWRAVAAAVVLIAVWANVHAVFMVGPLLIAAALAGVGLRWLLGDAVAARQRAGRLAVALGLGLVAALLNPRGLQQHLAFLSASKDGAIWGVIDEWSSFDPFTHSNFEPAVSPLAWATVDVLLVGFALLAAIGFAQWMRERTAERLDASDPVRFVLGIAGIAALLTSIRFLWLAVFPILFVLHRLRAWSPRRLDLVFAAATVALAGLYPVIGGFDALASLQPQTLRTWLANAYTERRFFDEGVRFLEATGVRGNLFHPYGMGGLLCYRLAPEIHTFMDGSMNFPPEVAVDYQNVNTDRGSRPDEGRLEVLDRRGIDIFFGVGVPAGGARTEEAGIYTAASLDGVPGWIPVSRSLRHTIYLRRNADNAENLTRVADWYASQEVPFDPVRGLDPGAVIAARPDWAGAEGMVPRSYTELVAAARPGSPRRAAALETLGLGYALAGAYEEGLANDREAVRLRPRASAPRRRLVYGLLRLGRIDEARREAAVLLSVAPADPRSHAFARAAQQPTPRALNGLPLLTSRNPLRQ
ncbi:MAG: hypothetical protein QF890_08800 [Myxococcota bacterium]|nr:hypothetical protein [Deltaproteobacteria bacterium]MCP4242546.1 hypothetical protein [bacterium]MDP6074376.1 hypothetical protein [Myxococcota bacterium]MDP6241994.1 hypothetical protein [Myxococcota bacterium]MDP7073761.1 hypothetical protein [Myxococcota bacterium]